MVNTLNCKLVGTCGGCPSAAENRLVEKENDVKALYPGAFLLDSPKLRVRDRADLVWDKGQLGLFGLNSREIIDMTECPMMSKALEAWLKEFRQKVPPITKGSVRLRVSPQGERGVWLDFANQDVKTLFTEKSYLKWLSERAFVEIGQRRKALEWRNGEPKLRDPILKPWFETYDSQGKPIPLYGPVGGFSQPGFASNRALVQAVCGLTKESEVHSWLELFSGNGNFSLALAALGYEVEALELDSLALEGLEMSLKERPELQLKISRGDVYLKVNSLPSLKGRGLLVDPPRAGLRELLERLKTGENPEALLYVSCFTEVFLRDSEELSKLGWRVKKLVGVDQFPFTPHCEWIALFSKDM